MAKGQKKSNKEIKKPKQEKAKAPVESTLTAKLGAAQAKGRKA